MVKKGGRVGKKGGVAMNRGPWTAEEDQKLVSYVQAQGDKKWRTLPANAGLNRCGKSCRLRWLNYLRPGIKRGNMSEDEEDLIIRLHNLLGNRWSLIAARLPGRTDNEIKNHWNTHLSKRSLTIDDLNNKLNQKSSVSTESNATNQDEDWLPCQNTEPPSLSIELSGSDIDVGQLLDLMSMPSPDPCDVVLCSNNKFGVEDFGITFTGQDSYEAIFDVELCGAKDDQHGCLDLQALSSPSQFDDLEQFFMDDQELRYIFHN